MTTNKRKGGRPQNEVWKHYTQGERDSEEHASGTCKFCEKVFSRGDVSTLQGHIANHCPNAPPHLIRKYQTTIKKENFLIKHLYMIIMILMNHYLKEELIESTELLLKFFVCCGISFRVVESPFFIDFINELNVAYDPPSRELLANRLFEDELGNVNSKIHKELQMSDNLTLGILLKKNF
jgi:hypothetical protein